MHMDGYFEINGVKIPYKIVRSSRQTLSIEVQRGPEVIVRAPAGMALSEITGCIEEKKQWIYKNYSKVMVNNASEFRIPEYMDDAWLRTEGAARFQNKVSAWAQQMHIEYGRITIRDQKTRWGSCSSKGNLNFNWRLLMMPEPVMDYVVVHELAHRKEMNHSPRFWEIVGTYIPDYQSKREWLRKNGDVYMQAR